MARLLTPTVDHPWPIRAPARPVEGHRAKRKPFEVKSTLIGVESSLVRLVSKQISHNHSPRRRLTIGSAFPTRLGRVSDELPRKKRRFAVLREIRHHFARFLQLSFEAVCGGLKAPMAREKIHPDARWRKAVVSLVVDDNSLLILSSGNE
ncbi:hypothetical protein Acr_15g0014100 [Actinidia rufa]|uniref:Uncharacterized protein n=1 Tax=Actinidia rufa TaxID=165716 RepID=A0A7J0FVT3_9ERIC|nr:hypothetical protein Acr_15g0014100 [Actinidia rufa]